MIRQGTSRTPPLGRSGRVGWPTRLACGLAAALFALVLAAGPGARDAAAEDGPGPAGTFDEHAVKAAFLYNFAKFTDWPREAFADADTPLRLCVLGEDPFGPALDMVAGKRVGARIMAIARLARGEDAGACHLLFIGASEVHRIDSIVREIAGRPVLTVADMPGFERAHGIIGLVTVSNKLRFRINLNGATRARLALSSKLLTLAERVHETATAPAEPSDRPG